MRNVGHKRLWRTRYWNVNFGQNNGENVVEYERVCKEHITRNEEYLSSLGLGNK